MSLPPPAREPGRLRLHPIRSSLAILTGCLLVAAAGAVGLDAAVDAARRRADPETAAADARRAAVSVRRPPLRPGTPAPPFTLPDVRTGEPVGLAGYRGRPVVLLFGSFGCTAFCGQLDGIRELAGRYRGRVEFVLVYGTEAPHGNPVLGPRAGDRAEWVRRGLEVLGVPFRCLLDRDGAVEAAYGGYPRRLVVVGPGGRVVYDDGGNLGEGDVAQVEAALRDALADPTR